MALHYLIGVDNGDGFHYGAAANIHDAGLAAKLGGAVALACEDRSNGGVIGIDDFAVGKFFALGEALRLFGDVPMGGAGGLQIAKQTLALGVAPGAVLVRACSGLLSPGLISAQALADIFVGGTQCVFEQFQGEQHPG